MACITLFHHNLVGIYFFNTEQANLKKHRRFNMSVVFFISGEKTINMCCDVSVFFEVKSIQRGKSNNWAVMVIWCYLIFAVYIGDYNTTQSYGDSSKPLFLYPVMNQSGLNGMSLLGFVERCSTEESSCLCLRWCFTLYHGIWENIFRTFFLASKSRKSNHKTQLPSYQKSAFYNKQRPRGKQKKLIFTLWQVPFFSGGKKSGTDLWFFCQKGIFFPLVK